MVKKLENLIRHAQVFRKSRYLDSVLKLGDVHIGVLSETERIFKQFWMM